MNVEVFMPPTRTNGDIEEEDDEDDVVRFKATEDSRYKEAVKRKSEWTKRFAKQRQDLLDQERGVGTKRKHDGEEPLKKNSKQRREEKRAAALKKGAAADAKAAQNVDLNENSMYATISPACLLMYEQFSALTMINQSPVCQRSCIPGLLLEKEANKHHRHLHVPSTGLMSGLWIFSLARSKTSQLVAVQANSISSQITVDARTRIERQICAPSKAEKDSPKVYGSGDLHCRLKMPARRSPKKDYG